MRTHPANVVAVDDQSAEVDVELAPLITEVWQAGIVTIHSCQDVGENVGELVPELPHLEPVAQREAGRASIGFADLTDLLAFHDAVVNAGPRDDFYERVMHWASPGAWQCVIALHDPGLEQARGPVAPDGTHRSRLAAASFQVRFPRSDIHEATDRLRRHNRGEQAAAPGRPTWVAIDGEERVEERAADRAQDQADAAAPPGGNRQGASGDGCSDGSSST